MASPSASSTPADEVSPAREVLRIVGPYLVLSAGWIYASDRLVDALFPNRDAETFWSILKGMAFVTATGTMIAVLLWRRVRLIATLEAGRRDALAQADAARHASLDRFRVAVESAPVAIFVQGDARFRYVNGAAISLFGAKAGDDLVGTPVCDRVPEADHPAVLARIRALNVERQELAEREQRMRRLDGRQIDVDLSAVPFSWEGRDGALVFARDVTDRKQSLTALRASERRIQSLNQLLRALRDVNTLILRERHPDRLLEEACQSLLKTRGYVVVWVGRSDPLGQCLETVTFAGPGGFLVAPFGLDEAAPEDGGLSVSAIAFREHRTVVCHDLAETSACVARREAKLALGIRSALATPLEHDGPTFGVLGVYADRPEAFDEEEVGLLEELAHDLAFALRAMAHEQDRLQAEERIRSQAALLDLAQDAILVRDLDDCVWYWNRGAAELYGWPADEVVGRPIAEICGPATPQFLAAKSRLLEAGSWAGELSQLRRGGAELTVSSRWTLVRDGAGRPKSVLVIDTDISERKRLEAQFLQAQKLESIGQLAGGVAHDFNNILAASMLQIELLRRVAGLPPEASAGLEELQDATDRAASLTRQLLLFSRRQAVQARRIDLNDVIGGLVKMLRRLVGEHIDTTLETRAGGAWVHADPGMLEQVVVNLCVNARDAMPKGGRLGLSIDHVSIDEGESRRHPAARVGRFVRLVVADTGEGMDAATLKRVFEPFFTTKEAGRGTGLGLATVYGIVRQHGGWVTVESSPGAGSRFSVFVPQAEPPGTGDRVPARRLPEVGGGHESILLVEDDPAVRRLASRTLRGLGYTVIEAASGVEALEQWDRHSGGIDVLVTDMVMPAGLTGVDLASKLVSIEPALKVVVASGYSPEQLRRASSDSGFHFLGKPFGPNELGLAVRAVLEGRSR